MDAAILAGGKASRMNYIDKSQLLYEGKTFLEIIISKLSSFKKIMVITNRKSSDYKGIKADFYCDKIKDIGPMGGIYTALLNAESHHVFFTTCDMPLIEEKQIQLLQQYDEHDIVVPLFGEKYEMLFAIYSRNCIPQFEKLIANKRYKITGIFEDSSLKVKKIQVDRNFINHLKNVNTEEEFQKL